MILNHIVAHSCNYVIGDNNKLLWHYPEDLQFFRRTTLNKIIIMGRKTFDSIVSLTGKPLPHRKHIIISRTDALSSENVFYVKSIEDAYTKSVELISEFHLTEDVFIIGGSEIYRQTLKDCQRLYITLINQKYNGDASYPEHYAKDFRLDQSTPSHSYPEISFQTWIRL